MTAGIAPITPTLQLTDTHPSTSWWAHAERNIVEPKHAHHSAQDATAPARPTWADPPPYFHWEPGIPCDQQLPKERCDYGPDNLYRTPDCPIPIVIIIYWADSTSTEELIGCMTLYDPSGYVRDINTNQPLTNATVSLYKVSFALPDTLGERLQ